MIIYYQIQDTDIGLGFITHEDQELNGLSFNITGTIIKVDGNEDNINAWNSRNNLNVVDNATAEQYIEQLNQIVINE